jgi:hypothetical protein
MNPNNPPDNFEIGKIVYHRVGKDVDSNKWWWATCYSEKEAENLVSLLNKYEKEIERLKNELVHRN